MQESVLFDTGRFSRSSTSPKAHTIANACIKAGVDPDFMHTKLFQHISASQIHVLMQALANMESFFNGKLYIQTIHEEHLNDLEHMDLEYLHDFNSMIENVSCIAVLRELLNNTVRLSLRSLGPLDISPAIHALGGGGHNKAGGTLLPGPVSEVKKRLLEVLHPLVKNLP